MSALPNFEEYVTCPYDSAHRILQVRLTSHLTRCAKNFPSAKLVRCPYNTTHLHSVADMQNHVIECPNRSAAESFKLPDTLPPVEPQPLEFLIESAEDWDAYPPVQTYNPAAHCENALVIRNLQGAPPAARRAFRESERRRFREKLL
ncbi:gametocyte-specific factor 1 homolog [Drosophila teissieri]|uniref:gametocyte-specific factor 1 homolog n=1 Tax=Drosophila teissieri TaxID=7243 RepID=UPI001CBA30F5|nr:gametocyte-specific factor 1 homolog [Drosophila teissieri]